MSRVPQYDLLPDWDKYLLGDICKLRSDNYEPKKNGTLKYIGLEHIESGIPIITNFGFETDVKSAKHRFYPNDILYGKLRPYLDKVALSNIEGISSSDILILKAEQPKILPKYLIKLLHHNRFLRYATSTMTGTTLPRTNWKTLRKFMIFLPKIVEQKKIVAILENVDKLIQTTQRLIEKLQECKKGLMQRLFTEGIEHTEFKETKLGKIPKEWDIDKLKNLVLYEKGRKPDHKYEFKKENYKPYLSTEYLRENKENFYVDPTDNGILANGNSIILVWDGSNAGEFFRGCDGVVSSTMVRIDIISKKVILDYLYYVCLTKERNIRRQTRGTGIPHVDKMVFKNIKIQLPSIEEQEAIIDILLNIDKKIKIEKKYKNKLKIIKKGLMQVLLTGKKRVLKN